MKPWFAIDGSFRCDGEKGWDYGTWSQAGIAGGGHATVQVWRYHDGSCLVGVSVGANVTPSQARTLAKALWAAAEKADAEDASPAPDIGLADMQAVYKRTRAQGGEGMTDNNTVNVSKMTDEQLIELGRRAVACESWRWMPGIRVLHIDDDEVGSVRGTYLSAGARDGDLRIQWDDHAPRGLSSDWGSPQNFTPHPWVSDYALPDLADPATVGALLALVREACEPNRAAGDWPMVCTYQSQAKKWGVGAWLNESGKATFAALVLPAYDTEAAALVAALAPGPAVRITDWFVDTTEFNNGTVVEQHQTDERMAIVWCYPKGDFLLQFCEKDKKGEYRVCESTRRFKTRGTIDLKVREWLEKTC